MKKIKLKYVHSPIGREQSQKDTVRCLGFTRLQQVREFQDTPTLRGMIRKVGHLVTVVTS